MLGERRNRSLFAPVTEVCPEAPALEAETDWADEPETDKAGEETAPVGSCEPVRASLSPHIRETPTQGLPQGFPSREPALTGAAPRAHNLFFTPDAGGRDFASVLRDVQNHISATQSKLINDANPETTREHLRRYIGAYIREQRIAVAGMSADELVGALYTEMAEFGFLTKYIYGQGIEEININSWDSIEVLYSSGEYVRLDEHFDSPEHAVNVVRRMLHMSGMILDNASPIMQGSLGKNIRLAVLKTPIVDEDVGVAGSIRIVNQQNLAREDFIHGGTASAEMLDFLSVCLRYGLSICVAGATGSGKTTLAGWLLTTLPDSKRIVTIEAGARELNLVRRDDLGKVKNRIVHLLTRESDNESMNIDQTDLIEITLRLHPDVVSIAEMRSSEANAAVEMALAGHAVISTIHSNSCDSTYRRIVTLCKRGSDMDDATLMGFATEAFPLIVFAKQLESKDRRIMEIMECVILPDNTREFRPLFRYNVTESRVDAKTGRYIINGRHECCGEPSESLRRRLLENGMPQDMLQPILKGDVPA